MIVRITCLTIAWMMCSAVPAGPVGPIYRYSVTKMQVIDLGTLGGAQSAALDINDQGDIVGWSATSQGTQHAFRYSNGLMDDIGGAAFGNASSTAMGINASGRIAGTMTDDFGTLAFIWDSGGVTWLFSASLLPAAPTRAAAIANNGDVCGFVPRRAPYISAAICWMSGMPPFLFQTQYDDNAANDLNSSQQVVGHVASDSPRLWSLMPPVTKIVPPPSFVTGPGSGDAMGINERGEVVGFFNVPGVGSRAYVWDGVSASSLALGVLPSGSNSVAEDINELQFIVGRADERFVQFPFDFTYDRAFLYHADFGLQKLPVLPATGWFGSCRATALNRWKPTTGVIQIVGSCDTPAGSRAAKWEVWVTRTRL